MVFNRAKQYTEEKLGKAERTQLDPHLVVLETKVSRHLLFVLIDILSIWAKNPILVVNTLHVIP